MQSERIPQDLKTLTSVRFIAALMIVIYHYFAVFGDSEGFEFYKKFYLGVDFFFVLSGFILMHVYYNSVIACNMNIRNFYIKRLAKIYPIHFLFTALFLGLVILGGKVEESDINSFLSHVFLMHSWGVEKELNYNSQSWSISAEWFAYLLFPSLANMFLKFKSRTYSKVFLIGAIILFMAVWWTSAALAEKPVTEWTYHFSILRVLPEFILGMALYNFYKYYKICPVPVLVLAGSIIFSSIFLIFKAHDCLTVLCFSLIIYALASLELNSDSTLKQALSHRIFIWLGEASYCLYMAHFLVLLSFVPFLDESLKEHWFYPALLVYIGLSVLLSGLLYSYIEVPARHASTRIFIK